jgi:hypothetical protein
MVSESADERRIATSLRAVGDSYLSAHPVDPAAARGRAETLARRRASRRGAGVALAASAALFAAVPWLLSDLGHRVKPAPESAAPTVDVGPQAPARAAAVGVGAGPTSLAVTEDGSVWVGHAGDNTVRRIDPAAEEVVETLHTDEAGQRPSRIATNGQRIFMSDAGGAAVAEVKAGPPAGAAGGSPAAELVYDRGSLWSAEDECRGDGVRAGSCVRRIYLSEGSLSSRQKTLAVGCCPITAVAVGDDEVWVATTGVRRGLPGVVRLPKTGAGPATATLALDEAPADLALGAEALWAALPDGRAVARIDVRHPGVAPVLIAVGSRPVRLALGRGVLWAAGWDGRVVRIDTDANEAGPPLEIGERLADIAVSRGTAWVAAPDEDLVYRVKP